MAFHKLAGINDIGEIIVHLDIREENDKRGVIGMGEPAVSVALRPSATRWRTRSESGSKDPADAPLVLAALERRNA
jgi:hypothetical protein